MLFDGFAYQAEGFGRSLVLLKEPVAEIIERVGILRIKGDGEPERFFGFNFTPEIIKTYPAIIMETPACRCQIKCRVVFDQGRVIFSCPAIIICGMLP